MGGKAGRNNGGCNAKGKGGIIHFMKIIKNIDMSDIHAYGGTLLIAIGCFFIFRPLALIVPGIILIWLQEVRR